MFDLAKVNMAKWTDSTIESLINTMNPTYATTLAASTTASHKTFSSSTFVYKNLIHSMIGSSSSAKNSENR